MTAEAGVVGSKWGRAWAAIMVLLAILLATAASAEATALPATISQNTTLTAAGNPYTGTSTVASGVTLKVEPGVVFKVSSLTVKGTLDINGTAESPVVFTGAKEQAKGEWGRVSFEPGSGASTVEHAEFKYGGSIGGGAVWINGSSPTITHSLVSHSSSRGINVSIGGSPEIAYNTVIDSTSTGIYYLAGSTSTGEVNIHDNLVEGGNYGISVSVDNAASVVGKSLGDNVIAKTKIRALYYSGPDIPGDITSNTLSENSSNVITIKEGTVVSASTWNDGGSPIKLEGETKVASGATLNITKGVQLIGDPNMNVSGTLNVNGTAEDPVVFTGANEEVSGGWGRVWFLPGSGASKIDHAEFRYGGDYGGGTIVINGSSPAITNSTISYSASRGISVTAGGSPEIAHNTVIDSTSTGIYYLAGSTSTGEVNIHDNLVEGGTHGIYVSVDNEASVAGKSLGNNTIVKTTNTALYYSGPDIPGDVTANSLEDNASEDIQVAGTVGHSATWKLNGAPVLFTETVEIPAGVTLNLEPGIYIRSPQMIVRGTLRAEGTQSRPVTLTGVGELEGGEWNSIRFEPGSGGSLLDYVNVGFGGSGSAMLTVNGSSPTITNSALRRSSGDAIRVEQSGQPTLNGIRFRNNQFGLRYIGEGKLSAPNNDWGCANGPKPTGCGDSVTSNVSWQPAVVLPELPRYCPGTTMPATSDTCLLQKYSPTLRLDSEENYLADNAAQITDNWGDEEGFHHQGALGTYTNELLDGSTVISGSAPWASALFPLSLSALGSSYSGAGGLPADEDDWIDMSNNYVDDAHRMEEAGYANAAYGHVVTDGLGKRWLEYWYWYYYNPMSVAGIGTHEGDWETVLIGLDANNRPLEVIFSQHDSSSNCYIGDVELTEEGAPVVYVALDSHANYRMAGSFDGGVVTDNADGEGPSLQPGLIIIGNSLPGWLNWPGHWGNSRGGGLNSSSPKGPAFQGAWSDPAGYANEADECSENLDEEFDEEFELRSSETAVAADISSVSWKGRQPQVEYRVPGADGDGFWPRLRISVNELGDGGIPAVSRTISDVKGKGRVALPFRLKPGHAAEVLGSVFYKNGRRVHLTPQTVRHP